MPPWIIVGVGVFLAGFIVGRLLGDRALEGLDDADRLLFADAVAPLRRYNLLPLGILVLWWLLASEVLALHPDLTFWSTLGLTFAYLLGINAIVLLRLGRRGLPRRFVKMMWSARLVQLVGVLAFLAAAVWDSLTR